MRSREPLLMMGLLALGVIVLSGCTALWVAGGAAAGAGTVAYAMGELKSTEEIGLVPAWEATQQAIKDLEFATTSKEKDAVEAKLIARGTADKKIKIRLIKQSDAVTQIRIRVGTFGDETLSRQILEKIKSHF